MKISLITATYNSSRTLGDCLESVSIQDHPHIEHIVVDGGSGDGTLSLIEKAALKHPGLKYISEPDSGIYDALNKGISLATGQIIGFLHSDDQLAGPNTISAIVKAFESTTADGVYGDLVYVSSRDTKNVLRYWKSRSFHRGLIKKGWMPAHPTLYLRKEVYEKHGNFDPSYKIAADYEFMLRVLKDTDKAFTYLPKILVRMRTGGASNRNLQNIWWKSKEDYRVMKAHRLPYPLFALLQKNALKVSQLFRKPPTK